MFGEAVWHSEEWLLHSKDGKCKGIAQLCEGLWAMSGSERSSCTCQWCQVQSHSNTTRSRVPEQPLGPVNTVLCAHMSWEWHKKVTPARGALISGEQRHRPLFPLCTLHQGSPWADGRSPARVAPKLLVLALGFKRKKCHQKCIPVSLFRAAQQYCLLLRKFYVSDNRSSWLCSTLYWFYDVPLCRHFM